MLEAALARLAPYRWLAIAVVICGLAVGLMRLGFVMADTARSAEIATLKRDYANAMATAERQAREQLQAQAARGDALTQRLAEQQAVAYRQAQEKDRAIHALTTGRPCLDARLVGVLNGTGGASVVADPVPTPTGSAAPADASVATDTDVAHWASDARQQYDACRASLDALIDWYPLPQTTEGRAP